METDYTTKDAIEFAADGNVSGFKDAVNGILMDKIRDAIELKKLEVSNKFMSQGLENEVGIEGDTDDQEV